MRRPSVPLLLSEDQSKQIEQWLAALGTPQQVALRCRIVAAAGGGESEAAIAAALEVNRKTVGSGVIVLPPMGYRACGISRRVADARPPTVRIVSKP